MIVFQMLRNEFTLVFFQAVLKILHLYYLSIKYYTIILPNIVIKTIT